MMEEQKFIADELASFAIQTKEFPPEVINEGKRLLLDQMACQIAFASLTWSKAYLDAMRSLENGGPATVVYHGDSVSADNAAFLNSAFGHGGEFDDTQLGSHTHSGAVVVPAVFALGELRKASGVSALASIIVGIETMVRIGAAAAPHLDDRGFHAPPVVGPFGSAAACSRIMGLNADICAEAIGIAGSHAGGTRQYTRGGGSVKRIHCAIPAASGLRSAVMASFGITGPRSIIEGDRGILALFSGEYQSELITKGLGRDYLLLESAYKPVTSPWPSHAPLEAIGFLQQENRFHAEDVATIEIGTSVQAMNNIKTIRAPRDILEAQYSLAYGIAVRIIRGGNGLKDYHLQDLKDQQFAELAAKVSFKVDPVCESERIRLKNRSAVVTLTLNDGRVLEKRVQFSKGHPMNPMTNEDLSTKFHDSVDPIIGKSRADQIRDLVWTIERLEDVGALIRLTVPNRQV